MKISLQSIYENLSKITVTDNGERMVPIKNTPPYILIDYSGIDLYYLRMAGLRRPYLRKKVADYLSNAQKSLPSRFTLVVRDAWRPVGLQKEIYESFVKKFRKQFPDYSTEEIINEVNKFVADPNGRTPPGHTTGGAVDVTLAYKSNKRKVPMKSSKLSYQENAETFPKRLSKQLRKNRKILYDAMTKSGFVNYPFEWWHYSFGDPFWAALKNRKIAFYSRVERIKDGIQR